MRVSLVLAGLTTGLAAELTMLTPATAKLPRCPIRASETPRADLSVVAGVRTVFYDVAFSYAGARLTNAEVLSEYELTRDVTVYGAESPAGLNDKPCFRVGLRRPTRCVW